MKTIRAAAGSVLVVGLLGAELTALERAWLRLIGPAGIILFRRNIADAQQTRALLTEAGRLCVSAPLRCVDLEGGTVDRLRDAVAAMPSARAIAQTGRVSLMREHGELIAREVLAFGFNTTLAPVLDLGLPESAAVMGSRAAGASATGVVQYSRAFLAGLKARGVVGCGKHFPGLGGGRLDSHLETPAIGRSWREIWDEDLVPYRELAGELPMVMVNHASYPETRSGWVPATASRFWVTQVLRKRIGYRGLIFSDDLEMGGILKFAPIEEAVVLGIRAGLDLMEICHSPELILRGFEALVREAERSAAFRTLLLERSASGTRLRESRFGSMGRSLSAKQLTAVRDRVLRFGDVVTAAGSEAR